MVMVPRVTVSDRPTRLNTGNMVQKLRRIRTEVLQIAQSIEDALDRLEQDKANEALRGHG